MNEITVLISWTCYGQWLHGDENGSVDPDHNLFETRFLPASKIVETESRERMTQERYVLDERRRTIVLAAIREVCVHRGWTLHAVHVRPTHVHVVVSGLQTPERMMSDFKEYASRALNAAELDTPDRKRWTRHGSTRYINDDAHLAAAVNYVLNKQGDPLERWPDLARDSAQTLPNGRGS